MPAADDPADSTVRPTPRTPPDGDSNPDRRRNRNRPASTSRATDATPRNAASRTSAPVSTPARSAGPSAAAHSASENHTVTLLRPDMCNILTSTRTEDEGTRMRTGRSPNRCWSPAAFQGVAGGPSKTRGRGPAPRRDPRNGSRSRRTRAMPFRRRAMRDARSAAPHHAAARLEPPSKRRVLPALDARQARARRNRARAPDRLLLRLPLFACQCVRLWSFVLLAAE